jgi:hypothetical protein
MKIFLIILFVYLSSGCNQTATKEQYSPGDSITKNADTVLQKKAIDNEWEEKGNRLRDTNYQYLNRILDEIVIIAGQHKGEIFYNGFIDTSVYHFKNLHAIFQFGHIFSAGRKHLLARRFINEYGGYQASLFSDIYILKGNRFEKIISDTADIGYYEDTLKDINLDGFKDFVISQYSSAGCCPRDDRIAYLYNNNNGKFETISFFNPEFDNKNKLIYEMDYGHPGEVSIEKNKWKGLSKVKVESISPTHFKNRIDSFPRPYTYTKTIYPGEKIIVIKEAPEEYRKLKNFEYFIQYQ